MSAPIERRPMTSEMGLSLAIALIALTFWGAYMVMLLAGELPLMLGGS